ncbi:MAG: carbohydrate ABC transporter permease [Bacillota bacterium]
MELYNPLSSREFIGLGNYIEAVKNPLFWTAFGKTWYFALFTVLIETVLGICIALILNQNFKGRGFVRGLIILPWALPYVVNGIMWKWIFDANYGAFNALLNQVGLLKSYQIWLGDPVAAFHIVILANIWKETPVAILLILAALQSVPKELYEAAMVDGATGFQCLRKVVLPMLKPVVVVVVILKTIWALKEFDLIYVMTKGGPADATNVLTYYIYQNTFKFLKFGYGSALAYILTLAAVILAVLYVKNLLTEQEFES